MRKTKQRPRSRLATEDTKRGRASKENGMRDGHVHIIGLIL